jgi:hypothetical protein
MSELQKNIILVDKLFELVKMDRLALLKNPGSGESGRKTFRITGQCSC